jgi:hypothetical protein
LLLTMLLSNAHIDPLMAGAGRRLLDRLRRGDPAVTRTPIKSISIAPINM